MTTQRDTTPRTLADREVSSTAGAAAGVSGRRGRTRRAWVERLLLHRPESSDAGGELGVASRLAEREAAGRLATEVVLALRSPADAAWACAVVPWLAAHGRQVWVRTAVRLPSELVAALDASDGQVELELAHPDPAVQRALLGPEVDAVAALLLQAQHLRALGIPVRARLGPLLPGLHEPGQGARPRDLDALLDHVHAASIREVTPLTGTLDGARLGQLSRVVSPGTLVAVGTSFGLTAAELLRPESLGPRRRTLSRPLMELFRARLRRAIDEAGLLRVPDLGQANPPVSDPRPDLAPIASGDLFAV